MSTKENNNKRLQELGGSDFEIADGQPDIRGWNVVDNSGRKLGEVEELIFDVESRKVRYIILDLEDNAFKLKSKNVLVPIGLIELHSNDDDVILNNVSVDQLRALPEYDEDDLNDDLELSIRNIFVSNNPMKAVTTDTSTDDFYDHEHFDDNLQKNRAIETSFDEHVRMRQEPSFLESEGTNKMTIDDDIDSIEEDEVLMDDRDAIPVTNSNDLLAGNDFDENDATDDITPPRLNSDRRSNENE